MIPLDRLPRRCPVCHDDTIIGHGRRRRQCHDDQHECIWVRRGICEPCGKTFTILPDWLAPVRALQPSLPTAVLRADRRRRFCRASRTALQGFNALARSLHGAPVGSTATAQRVVLDQDRSQRPALSADTHHRCLGSGRALPYSADRGKKSVNRQALDELKQQIPLMGYLQAHDWQPGPATQPRPIDGAVSAACRSQTELSGGSPQGPLLLLRLRSRRGRDSLRRTLSPGEVSTSAGVAPPMARCWRRCCTKSHVSIACSYTATARRLPIWISAESARRN